MQDELAESRRWMTGGLLAVALGLALVVVPPAASRLAENALQGSDASIDVERRYLPLEWNGSRHPVRFDHMFMSAPRQGAGLKRTSD